MGKDLRKRVFLFRLFYDKLSVSLFTGSLILAMYSTIGILFFYSNFSEAVSNLAGILQFVFIYRLFCQTKNEIVIELCDVFSFGLEHVDMGENDDLCESSKEWVLSVIGESYRDYVTVSMKYNIVHISTGRSTIDKFSLKRLHKEEVLQIKEDLKVFTEYGNLVAQQC